MHENELSAAVLDVAVAVHRALGPGLLESVYEVALGLLVNFGAPVLFESYERLVNGLDEQDRAGRGENAERPAPGRPPA
ncbi:MAG: GxxExxY protein [Myxococcota bacterium]